MTLRDIGMDENRRHDFRGIGPRCSAGYAGTGGRTFRLPQRIRRPEGFGRKTERQNGRLPLGRAAGLLEEDEASRTSGEESGNVRPDLLTAFIIAGRRPGFNRNWRFCFKQKRYLLSGPAVNPPGARAASPRLASSSETPYVSSVVPDARSRASRAECHDARAAASAACA